VLPSSLKRAEQCLDEENFEKLSKKIKIDWFSQWIAIICLIIDWIEQVKLIYDAIYNFGRWY
jgi:hypothetical protein